MMRSIFGTIFLGSAIIGGLALSEKPPHFKSETTPKPLCHGDATVIVDYIRLPLLDRIKSSSFIVSGVVTSISPTKWNQDSGEYWEELSPDGETRYIALPYFTIEISDVFSLSTPVREDKTIITIIGKSPIECDRKSGRALRAGSRVVVFGRETELSWRSGQKAIFGLVADPVQSILVQGPDDLFHSSASVSDSGIALEDLKEMIAEDPK